MTVAGLHTLLQAVFRTGVLVTLCVAPTQGSLEVRPKLFLSPADLTLAFTAGVWFLDVLVCRDWRRLLRLPPWPHLLFVGCAAASAVVAADRGAALKDLVQFTEYFIVGAMVFEAFLREGGGLRVRQALMVLGGMTAVALGFAAVQYVSPGGHRSIGLFADGKTLDIIVNVLGGRESPLLVGGTFGNRNVLGGFLALALPLCFAGLAGRDVRAWVRVLCGAGLAAGLAVNLSGASYFAVAGVILCMAAVRGARWFVPAAAALLLWQAAVLPRLPRVNDLAHFQSVALYGETGAAERRYPAWQAAYGMVLTNPWLGVGLGNYQKHVGQYYDVVPRETGPSEPDIQNLYLVLAASCGLPGLFAFLAVLAHGVASAVRSAGRSPVAWGVAGSLCAFAATAVWHPLLVRGIGLPFVFLLVLARYLGQSEKHDGL